MDWTTRMNRALEYIEERLDADIDLKQAAKLAYCSVNNFSNMFLMTTGIQVSEYIRRRRLTLAALELQNSDEKIIDIALKYGYSSPTAFTRAFQNQHKAPPMYVRSRKIPLIMYPRISLQINLQGAMKMKCRIEQRPAFTVVGIKKTFQTDTIHLIPKFWEETPRKTYDQLRALANTELKWFVGICADFDGSRRFDYYITVPTTHSVPEGFVKVEVPAATWAILEKDGDLISLSNRFWKEWLPSSGYRRAGEDIPDIEVYPDADMPKPDYNYELWYPVVKA